MFHKQLKFLAFGIKKLSWILSHWYLSSPDNVLKDTLKFKIISGWNKANPNPSTARILVTTSHHCLPQLLVNGKGVDVFWLHRCFNLCFAQPCAEHCYTNQLTYLLVPDPYCTSKMELAGIDLNPLIKMYKSRLNITLVKKTATFSISFLKHQQSVGKCDGQGPFSGVNSINLLPVPKAHYTQQFQDDFDLI